MNTKVILVGFIVAIVATAGIVVALTNHSDQNTGGDATIDLNGYWYTVDGKVLIEGIGVQEILSDDCDIPNDFANIRVDESKNNVFYGMVNEERITGTYFDDGRIVFEYSNDGTIGAPNKVFSGVYDKGLIYGMTAFNYEIDGVDKACVLTYVLSKDPTSDVELKALPNIKGDWKLSESYILVKSGLENFDEGTLSVETEAENGLFECTLTTKKGNTESESILYGMFLNTPLHGKYYGYLIDPVNKQTWDITFDGNALVAQTVLKDSTPSLSAVSCTFTSDGNPVETKFPQVKKDVYYSEKSMWACIPKGIGTIVKSNTPFMVNVVTQVGPCFLGTVIIDGMSLVSAGTVNIDGHFTICCLMGPVTDFAYGVYVNDNMEVCANIYTEYLGRCSRYVDLATMPENKFVENIDGLIGSWTVSSYASPSGETETIFSERIHQIPLYIKSVENGIVRGYLFDTEFVGTYGPTSTGYGSLWIEVMFNGKLLCCEIIYTQSDLLSATMSYVDEDSSEPPQMCQIIYTKDTQYSPVPNRGVDIFGYEWETYSYKVWDGTEVQDRPNEYISITIERPPKEGDRWGLESFFDLTYNLTVPDHGVMTKKLRGAFYDVGVYGNGIANIYGVKNDSLSLCYFDGKVYLQGSIEHDGNLFSFSAIFKKAGSTDDSRFDYKSYEIKGKTFKKDAFSLTVTNQEGPFVYGTISSSYDGKTVNGKFIGLQLSIGGPTYIETVLLFDDGKTWDAHIVLFADDSDNVTHISFEAIWHDKQGNSNASRVIAYC